MVMAARGVGNGGHHPSNPMARYPHDATEQTMCRTFYPKYASYTGDGSGRDSYITINNGGLANNDKKFMMWRPAKLPRSVQPKPYKLAAAVNYRSDGTGRDSYCVSNNGGLVSDFSCSKPEVIFKSGLRQHYISPVRNIKDRWRGPDQTDYLNWMTPKDQAAKRAVAQKQRQLTNRLSPHKIQTKYDLSMMSTTSFSGFPQTSKTPHGISHVDRVKMEVAQKAERRHRASGNGVTMPALRRTLDINQEDLDVTIPVGSLTHGKNSKTGLGNMIMREFQTQRHHRNQTITASSVKSPMLSKRTTADMNAATLDYYGVGDYTTPRASTQMDVQESARGGPTFIEVNPKLGMKKLNRADISTFLKDQRFADKKEW